jgi:HD-GYP domain-containing protein (c-di-GMP phosphodiesterase class II)
MASALPELPSAQLRLCDGLEGILNAVRDRLILLHELLTRRREDVELLDTLSLMLHRIATGEPVAISNLIQLADRILKENLGGPLRMIEVTPGTTQLFLGGTSYPAPTRYVAAHSLNMARTLARIVIHDREWRDNLREPLLVALVHNVGMIRLGLELIGCPTVLTEEQRRQLELHPRLGVEMLEVSMPELQPLFPVILDHHERMNGTGYAHGLKRDKIVPLARLLSVVDCYVALCSPRPYRLAVDPRTALTDTLMLAESGLLDRVEGQKLLRLSFYPIGSVVELSDGSVAVVVSNHSEPFQLTSALRPVVAVLVDSDGRLLPSPRHIDLHETMQGTVLRALRREERATLLARQYPMWV